MAGRHPVILAHMDDSLILGLHGKLALLPGVPASSDDAYSLVVSRSCALGLSFTGDQTRNRWGHNDAGGDWDNASVVAERVWCQVRVTNDGLRLPVLPLANVLFDVAANVGDFEFAGLHAVAPIWSTYDDRKNLAYEADWFRPEPRTKARVSVTNFHNPSPEFAELISAHSFGRVSVSPIDDQGQDDRRDSEKFTGTYEAAQSDFDCIVPAWSIDSAAFVVSVFLDALRVELGKDHGVVVSIFSVSQ
jgi:hypothetical protein